MSRVSVHQPLADMSSEDNSCQSCNLIVRPRQEAIQCDHCHRWTHRTCNTERTTIWRCSIRNNTAGVCPATITQCGDIFTPSTRSHTHSANPGADTAAKVARDVKRKAKENVCKSAREIVNEVLLQEIREQPIAAVQNPEYLARNANYLRQMLRPDDPKDLDFELQLRHIPDGFFRKDIKVDNKRHIIFATDAQLRLLQNAKRWYIDSTFKVVRKPFTQLFSVHAFIRQEGDTKQVPLLFSLMSSKRTKDYVAVLNSIKTLCDEFMVRELVIDFEAAMWNAFREVYPGTVVRGCAFHFTQALWRKIQDIGLACEYKDNRSVNKYLRKFMALCFLPHEKIVPMFRELEKKADSSPKFQQFVTYVDKTWLSSTVWPPQNWSVFNQSVRTNNDTEGWHNRLNGRSGCNAAFYTLVGTLHFESLLVTLNTTLLSERKLQKRQRKQYRQMQSKLFETWSSFIDGEINTKQLSKICSTLNGPTA